MIFIVDDDESVRKAMRRLMKSVGFTVETFCSAEDFLNRAPLEQGDCLILDIRMPGMSGLDLQRELAARGSKLPIIFLTAHEDETVQEMATGAGAVAVLGKPVEDHVLLDAINRARHRNRTGECQVDDACSHGPGTSGERKL